MLWSGTLLIACTNALASLGWGELFFDKIETERLLPSRSTGEHYSNCLLSTYYVLNVAAN